MDLNPRQWFYHQAPGGLSYCIMYCIGIKLLSLTLVLLSPSLTSNLPIKCTVNFIYYSLLVYEGLFRVLDVKLQIQLKNRATLSPNDHKSYNISRSLIMLHSAENNPNVSYYYGVNISDHVEQYWDLGSALCDSAYPGICDQFIKLPSTGCSGPGCGSGKWQDTNGRCYSLSDFEYKFQSKNDALHIWPRSLYNRYYSTCNVTVIRNSRRNCQ